MEIVFYLRPGVKSTQHLLHEINILLLRFSCLQCLLLGINIKRETTTTTTRKNNNNRSGESDICTCLMASERIIMALLNDWWNP